MLVYCEYWIFAKLDLNECEAESKNSNHIFTFLRPQRHLFIRLCASTKTFTSGEDEKFSEVEDEDFTVSWELRLKLEENDDFGVPSASGRVSREDSAALFVCTRAVTANLTELLCRTWTTCQIKAMSCGSREHEEQSTSIHAFPSGPAVHRWAHGQMYILYLLRLLVHKSFR